MLGLCFALSLTIYGKNPTAYDVLVGISCSLIGLGVVEFLFFTIFTFIYVNSFIKKIYERNIFGLYFTMFSEFADCTVTTNKNNEFTFHTNNATYVLRFFNNKKYINVSYNQKKLLAIKNDHHIMNHKYRFSFIYYFYKTSTYYQSLVVKIIRYIDKNYQNDILLIRQYFDNLKI